MPSHLKTDAFGEVAACVEQDSHRKWIKKLINVMFSMHSRSNVRFWKGKKRKTSAH